MTKDPMTKDPMTKDPMAMDAMGVAPPMSWRYIHGRQGTNVKTNYDDSD